MLFVETNKLEEYQSIYLWGRRPFCERLEYIKQPVSDTKTYFKHLCAVFTVSLRQW